MAKNKEIIENQIDPTEELLALRAKVQQLEAEKEAAVAQDGSYVKEMENLRKGQRQGLNEILVKEIAPKTVSLWHVSGHNVGKRVGPIDANNAEETFLRFAFFKIRLSMTKPTSEWIEKYKETKEYKDAAAAEVKRRAGKNNSKKESEVEKLTQAIGKMQGIPASEVNRIKDKSEVKGRI